MTSSQPRSMARAAMHASATSGPLMSLQRLTNTSQCRRLGAMKEERGQSTRRSQNATAVSIGVGGSRIRAFVTMRRKPESTTSDNANGSSEAVNARSQAA